MMDNNWDSSILDLLFVCPHLTHFSYIANGKNYGNSKDCKSTRILDSAQILYNNLIHLHVDSDSHSIRNQVHSIISRSPNLRYFIGSDKLKCEVQANTWMPPEFVLGCCPKLEYYAGDGSYDSAYELVHKPLAGSLTLTWPWTTTSNNYSNDNQD